MAAKGVKRGPYRRDFLKVRPDGYSYHRAVPVALQPLLGRKSWHAWIGSNRRLNLQEAERAARQHAVAHDTVLAAVERLSDAERSTIITAGGLETWARGVRIAQMHTPLVKLAAELTPNPDQPDDMQAQDALAALRAREFLALVERDTKTARKLSGDTGDTLRGLVDLWAKVKAPRNPATLPTARRFMEWFVAAVGDKEPRAVTANHVRAFRSNLEKDGRSYETIKKALERLSAVFNVAVAEGKCDLNPFHRIKPHGRPAAKLSTTRRLPWTPQQLRTIVSRLDELGPDEAMATKLLIYHGCRPNEVCQLRCDDVVKVDGIDALRITDEGELQSLKNEDSRRTIPIHPAVQADVIAFLESRRKAGKDRMFDFPYMPSLGTFSQRYGERFRKWKREALGYTNSRQVAHSFRHSFEDACERAGVQPYVILKLMGHARGHGNVKYGVGVGMRDLAEAMAKADPLSE